MKFTKKLLSLLLAVVMVITMLGGSLTSLASITVSDTPITVSIVVPELIYLKPGATSFQYYIAGAANGVAPSSTAATQGSLSFSVSKTATNITVKAGGADSVTLSSSSASNTTSLVSQITAGNKSGSGLITWTFSYVIDGKQYTSTAYTYVYKPYLGQVGAQLLVVLKHGVLAIVGNQCENQRKDQRDSQDHNRQFLGEVLVVGHGNQVLLKDSRIGSIIISQLCRKWNGDSQFLRA